MKEKADQTRTTRNQELTQKIRNVFSADEQEISDVIDSIFRRRIRKNWQHFGMEL